MGQGAAAGSGLAAAGLAGIGLNPLVGGVPRSEVPPCRCLGRRETCLSPQPEAGADPWIGKDPRRTVSAGRMPSARKPSCPEENWEFQHVFPNRHWRDSWSDPCPAPSRLYSLPEGTESLMRVES